MGRYDFRALRVRQTAKALFDAKRELNLPQWYEIVGDIPPGETLARPVLRAPKMRRARKASKLFKPLPIRYEEDKLRSEFFGDHPWELARPRLVVEDSGNDAKAYDWSKIVQLDKQLDGESVVQRQMWLMKHKSLSKASAYDAARREFYAHRHLAEIRARIAKEEALHVGAYFGKGPLEIGMELEDRSWESWKRWATSQIDDEQAMRASMFSGQQEEAEGGDTSDAEYEESPVAERGDAESLPKTPEGKVVQDGATPAHARAFCFWRNDGKPLYKRGDAERYARYGLTLDGVAYHGLDTSDIPAGFASVPVLVDDNGVVHRTKMIAGSLGVRVESSGEKDDKDEENLDSLKNLTGWVMFEVGDYVGKEGGRRTRGEGGVIVDTRF